MDGSAEATMESSMLEFLETADLPSKDVNIVKVGLTIFSENLLCVRCMSQLALGIVAPVFCCIQNFVCVALSAHCCVACTLLDHSGSLKSVRPPRWLEVARVAPGGATTSMARRWLTNAVWLAVCWTTSVA